MLYLHLSEDKEAVTEHDPDLIQPSPLVMFDVVYLSEDKEAVTEHDPDLIQPSHLVETINNIGTKFTCQIIILIKHCHIIIKIICTYR